MSKELSIYFYKVEPDVIEEEYFEAQELLKEAFSFPDEKKYTPVLQTGGNIDLFGERKRKNNLVLGTFTYIQLENIPPKQNIKTKNTRNIDLDDDEGLGYQTSFLFDRKTNIIIVVNRRPGVNVSSIKKFVQNNFDLPKFNMSLVVSPSELYEFLNTPNYKKVRIKIANPTEVISLLDNNSKSMKEIIQASQNFKPNEILYEVKAKSKESLVNSAVRKLINLINKSNESENIKEIKIWGSDDVEGAKFFDFISNRLKDSIIVETGRFGNFRIKEVFEQLEEKYKKYKPSLIELYSNKKSDE